MPYSNDMAVNQLISTNLAAIATFENERRKEQQRQGIQAAKKNGKYLERRTIVDTDYASTGSPWMEKLWDFFIPESGGTYYCTDPFKMVPPSPIRWYITLMTNFYTRITDHSNVCQLLDSLIII